MKYKEAVEILFNNTPTDYIIDYFGTPDFFEFHVSCGGDACTYRIYKADGRIHEK